VPVQRLTISSTALLVIDVQDRLMPTIHRAERLVNNCTVLCRAAPVLGVPVIATEQYVRGLGPTVPQVRASLPDGALVVQKTRFSAAVDEVRTALRAQARPNVLVCGIEAHVCVLQTVLDLCAGGWNVFCATDAISAGQANQIDPAFRRMERAGAVPTGVLSALYELMGDAEHPKFKECLGLAKQVDMRD
jgi:nicotinamidase-related amidase